MTSAVAAPAVQRNSEVDSLRCFAMLAVVAMHTDLIPFGWAGVWLFYVISGYVVTLSLTSHAVGSAGRWLKTFYAKRAARIVPVYLLYICVGLVVAWIATGSPPWAAFASLALFYNNFAMIFGFGEMPPWSVGHLWTISVEMQFYAVYGLLFVFLPRRVLTGVLIAMIALSPLARMAAGAVAPGVFGSDLASAYAIYATSFLHFDSFAIGALLALNWQAVRSSALPGRLFALGVAAFGAYAVAYVGVNALVLDRSGVELVKDVVSGILFGQGREVWMYSALAILNCGLLAWTASGRAPWRALTRVRVLQWIGEISYGAYIFHALAIVGVCWALGAPAHDIPLALRPVVFVLASAVAIAAAAVSSRFLEKPCIRWANRRLAGASARPGH